MTKIIFSRHANAAGAAEGQTDRQRLLSDKGREQAQAALEQLTKLGFIPDLVIASDALRAVETASILGGTDKIAELSELYYLPSDPEDAAAMSALFSKLGVATLEAFRTENKDLMDRHGQLGAEAIKRLIAETGAKTILVVGHGVTINAAAAVFSEDSAVLSTVLGEAENLIVELA